MNHTPTTRTDDRLIDCPNCGEPKGCEWSARQEVDDKSYPAHWYCSECGHIIDDPSDERGIIHLRWACSVADGDR